MLELVFQQIFNGVIYGLILATISTGLTILFGWMNIINIAHGALYTLGALIAFYSYFYFGSFAYAFGIAPVILVLVAVVLYISVFRHLLKRQESIENILLSTYGILYIMEQIFLLIFGGLPRKIYDPLVYSSIYLPIIGYVSLYRVLAAIISIGILCFLWIFLNRTSLGLKVKAVKQDAEIAVSFGIKKEAIYLTVLFLGFIFAGISGVTASPIGSVHFKMGSEIIIDVFLICMVAGLGNIKGVSIISLIYGITLGVFSVFMIATYAKIMVYILYSALLFIFPNGVFKEV